MRQQPSSSRGAVLLLCLILLIALSLLGLAAASDQQLQERINDNIEVARQDQEIARLGSLWAQAWLSALPGDTVPATCGASCPEGAVILPAGSLTESTGIQGPDWWQSNAWDAGLDPVTGSRFAMPGIAGGAQAHWLVQELRVAPFDAGEDGSASVGWYRILARGSNGLHGTSAVTESIFARPWGEASWRRDLSDDSGQADICPLVPAQFSCGRQAWRELP